MSEDTARTFGLDPDPERGDADVPLQLEQLRGRVVNVEGNPEDRAHIVVVPELFRHAARLKREAARIIRIWQAGNLVLWSQPLHHGDVAVVQIRDEEGRERFEEIRYPVYAALVAAQLQGDDHAT